MLPEYLLALFGTGNVADDITRSAALLGLAGGAVAIRNTPAFRHRLAQQKLDLRVDAAQIVGSPFFQILPQVRLDPQQKSLAPSGTHAQV